MPTACTQLVGSKISLESERLVIAIPASDDGSPRETRRDIPLRDLDRMGMGDGVSATTPALVEMLRRNIPISFIDGRGRFLGSSMVAIRTDGHGGRSNTEL